ncbi:MAG: type II toxin-antitoxin system RelB/DinJ family antitoxin [Candidatus Peregrinibacteria bacterium]|nr:type II toxin-antitoxin system RelB/DinJ family antitoxin [Candidatus Peregrinibacteria bacterium]
MANIQIRISEEEKIAAQEVLQSMGLTLSGAIKMFLKKTVADGHIPFKISAQLTKHKKTVKVTPKKEKITPQNLPQTQQAPQPNSTWTNFERRKIG